MSFLRRFPQTRLRRMRQDSFARRLQREHQLLPSDLIWPTFIRDSTQGSEDIASMPGQKRLGTDQLLRAAERCLQLNIPAIAIFPVVDDRLKSDDGKEAYRSDGLVPQAVRQLKSRFPELGIITDVALDPYTSHGQDGILDPATNQILNDETVSVLRKQALCHAEAGADIVAPSDMMDGRIGAIRKQLDEHGFCTTKILSYAAKYASCYYGPFRDAVSSAKSLGKASKESYQMDPANAREALSEAGLDVSEGADIIMVKPGGLYLDIVYRLREAYLLPTFAYQVSGEYAMIKAAAANGWLDEQAAVLEALTCYKRAGCDGILSYYAIQAAEWLKQ